MPAARASSQRFSIRPVAGSVLSIRLLPAGKNAAEARPGLLSSFADAIPQQARSVNQQPSIPIMLQRSMRDFDRS
jgi:hypothetical protein